MIDIPSSPRSKTAGPLKSYEVVVNGHRTTLRLNDADAQRRGLTPADEATQAAPAKAARPGANKARQAVPGK